MASPVREREARLESPLRVGLVFLSASLALTAVLLAACGGGDDHAKVEASLRQYLSTVDPQQSLFPLGGGRPRVRENSCKKVPIRPVRPAPRRSNRRSAPLPEGLSDWSCVVTFGKSALPVAVAVKSSGEVYWAAPVSHQALPPATVYEGGP